MEKQGVPIKGEHYRMASVCNTMVDQLNTITYEVTRVAREVGMDGQLGGHATVVGASGSWKDLTDKVLFPELNCSPFNVIHRLTLWRLVCQDKCVQLQRSQQQ